MVFKITIPDDVNAQVVEFLKNPMMKETVKNEEGDDVTRQRFKTTEAYYKSVLVEKLQPFVQASPSVAALKQQRDDLDRQISAVSAGVEVEKVTE
jgi:hypothetical protein